MLTSLKKSQISKYLESPETYATVLLAILLDNYGSAALNWDIETIDREIKDDFQVQLPQVNRDKINAIITAQTTDLPFTDWFVFNVTCEALNSDPVDPAQLDPITPEQAAWGITELYLNEPPKERREFSDEVKRYLGAILANHAIYQPVDVLRIAQLPSWASKPVTGLETDPAFAGGQFSKQNSDNEYIIEYLKENVARLMKQLDSVPLENRDEKSWGSFSEELRKSK